VSHTLLAIHAHPDDESSKGAGTVARYADAGVRCILVTATGGEAGDVLNPAMDTPEVKADIGAVRLRELDEAARIIGYDRLALLGYRDSGMADTEPNGHPDAFVNAPFEDVLAGVVAVIREERPHVILGYDEHVRYPHPDHLRVHDVSLAAFDAAADPSRFPEAGPAWAASKLYAPMFSLRRLTTLHEAVLARGLESPFESWLERRGDEPDPEESAHIDVSATMGRARKALLAHRTQVDPSGFWFQIPEDIVMEAYPFEDFELMASRVPVQSPESDLFAGVPDL